jgi:hypothetical protein
MSNGVMTRRTATACAVLIAAALQAPSAAQPGEEQRDSTDAPSAAQCLNHPTIRRTRVLGPRNIVFITRDDTIYNNVLPEECPSLKRGGLVNYAITNKRLCAGDSFQVLWEVGTGSGGTSVGTRSYIPAFVCQLGSFAPITEDELDALTAMTEVTRERRSRRTRDPREAVTTEQVELPDAERTPAPAAPEAAATE